jgi:hypothetical protein
MMCAIGCALMLTTRQGRVFTVWAEIFGIAMSAALSGAYLVGYLNMISLPLHFLAAQLVEMVMSVIAGSGTPLLVIAVLTRKDFRGVLVAIR